MKKEVKEFLSSGKLEEYLMGLSSPEDRLEVELFISRYPEIKREYDALQKDLETYAESVSQTPPPGLKATILNEIDQLDTSSVRRSTPPTATSGGSGLWKWAAILAALLAVASSVWFSNRNASIAEKLQASESKIVQLTKDCEAQNQQMAALQAERALLLHPATQTAILQGDAMGSDLYAAAFWNKEKAAAHINVDYLPKPPDQHCFQIWADVDGKMVNLGILPATGNGMVMLPFKENATSLNITIEPEGGSEHPTVSRLVASAAV